MGATDVVRTVPRVWVTLLVVLISVALAACGSGPTLPSPDASVLADAPSPASQPPTVTTSPTTAASPADAMSTTEPSASPAPATAPIAQAAPSPSPMPHPDLPVLSAYGTVSPGAPMFPYEWSGAAQLAMFVDPPRAAGEGKVPVTVLVQNDQETLYLLVLVGRPFDDMQVELIFDNDDDGVPVETGDDVLIFGRSGKNLVFEDASWYPCPAAPGGTPWCLAPDKTEVAGLPPTGTAAGQLAYRDIDGIQAFEFDRPLRSGDARDVDLAPAAVVGVQIVIGLGERRPDAVCAGDACGGGGNAWARIARASSDAAHLTGGPYAAITELGPAAVNGWHRGPTKVRVTGAGGTTPRTATRTWGAPAETSPLGARELRMSGNAVHEIRGDGTTIVHAFAIDAQGRQGAWVSLPVRIDTAPPTVTPPRIVFRQGAIVGGMPPSTLISWYGTDAASGVARYELQESANGEPYRTIATGGSRMTDVARGLAFQTVYRYRVRATDVAGNVGLWVEGMPYRLYLVDSTSERIALGGGWTEVGDDTAIGASVLTTTDPGATARLEFLGSAIALVAPGGDRGGVVSVELDGRPFAGTGTVDLASPGAAARVAYTAEWSGNGRRVIEVRADSAASQAPIAIDAFLIVTPVWSPNAAVGGRLRPVYEAEHLAAVGDVTWAPWVQAMSGYGRGVWSNNRQLAWAARLGETLGLSVPVTPGRWLARVYLTGSPTGGIVEIGSESSGKVHLELRRDEVSRVGPIELGTIEASSSTSVSIDFKVAGESGSDTGRTDVGIDRIDLEPAP